ncbi:MAG TPA: DUF2271 domain-containing protein [Bacteroidales bacterium]|jgi:thiamine biosynthesis lipoprotein|nr:DUF2271 domain-containing protein [Bacteroidales bacterium]MDI9552662.1 DUF2271 domain-containing protein [Bacteroidota bacterium]MBP7038476.1 DUF2271 domain-containing protein [Bacteroidales bacterium]MZP66914.1 DUF2271 domain-containing protein [Bacteroidales bacterium]NLK55100.1 DUF2271 domain-containing protein [Bacteroidales bacterium]
MKILYSIILAAILLPGTSYGMLNTRDTRTELSRSQIESTNPVRDFELNIELELSRFEGRSLRPFVAVWVENEKSEPVRTLALWYNNNRWLPDLKRWYAKHFEKLQKPVFTDAVSGATRSAGKYTIKWDMKDDSGNTVEPGKYTVYIEAVRERGTYQLINREIELNEDPKRIELEGGIEIASAFIEYVKLSPEITSSR